MEKWWKKLGPGLVTGASDDDPSGIATYSITGAQTGYRLLWLAPYTIPLMIVIQEMCARIGLVTGEGLAGTIRRHYSRFLLVPVAILLIAANTLNVGADLHGMASAMALLLPVPEWLLALGFAALIVVVLTLYPYYKIARALKWLTFSLLTYIAAAFVTQQDWLRILWSTLVPQLHTLTSDSAVVVAMLGTTISPYLFFWMASQEVEDHEERVARSGAPFQVTEAELKEMRGDVSWGMAFSNVIMFFIVATSASVFFGRGLSPDSSSADVASALRPLAGNAAFLLFALGVIGTGLLAIPVLAGSSAYVLTEAFGLRGSLSRKFHEARAFYGTIIFSGLVGFLMTLSGYGAVYMLFMTAVVYGVISPPLIALILHIANNKKVMGAHCNGWFANLFGLITLAIMTVAACVLFTHLSL